MSVISWVLRRAILLKNILEHFWLSSGRLWISLVTDSFSSLKCNVYFHESESEVAQLCPTLCDPWTVAHQAPPSMGFSRQEYWSGMPFPSLGDLPDPGIEPASPALAGGFLITDPSGKPTGLIF